MEMHLVFSEVKIDQLLEMMRSQLLESRQRKMEQISSEILDSKEAAQTLKITVRHLDKLRADKKLGFMQDGKIVRYKKAHLDKYINDHSVNR